MSEKMKLPAIVLQDMTIMPGMIIHFDISKSKALKAVEKAMLNDELVFVITKRNGFTGEPSKEQLYQVGILSKIRQVNKLPQQHVQLLVEGLQRARLEEVDLESEKYMVVDIETIDSDNDKIDKIEREAMLRVMREIFLQYGSQYPNIGKVLATNVKETDNLDVMLDQIIGNIPLPFGTKQLLIETAETVERYEKLSVILNDEINVAKARAELTEKIKERVNRNQKEYVLREQMQFIRKELGEDSSYSDADQYTADLEKLVSTDSVKAKIAKEISRFKALGSNSSEASVERGYIETLLEMPWDKVSEDNQNIVHARQILDEDHYGLDKVKERVLEFLSVRTLTSKGDSPIICLVGPPGTGKTSIAKSVARALDKKYVRICLGGVRDEAEIRGHRKTYVGAMPGRIATGLKQAGVKNPLMLLDEIDKISSDYKGDTSSALLEVLDSEQNAHFRDHYVEIPIDLSEVLFIATANSVSTIPRPLLDRMELIEVTSYTANEKYHIAKEHLLRKQYEKNGMTHGRLSINDTAIKSIIEYYTREAGVRELERKIGEICRKAAKEILETGCKKVSVTGKNLTQYLGKIKYHQDSKNKTDEVGIVRGLAWTSVGGDTLQIEVNVMPGKGEIDLTGQMGDVMKESAMAGISYIRSVSSKHKIPANFFQKHDVHIHIPEGAVPKDGPSAGITMATAVLSAVTGIPVSRNIAMTGEITLRGRVLPIGGLKEKILAAKTAGIYKVLVPSENRNDVTEISDEILEGMEIVYVSSMKEVLEEALVRK